MLASKAVRALPENIEPAEAKVTGVPCVECPGVVGVHVEGRGTKTLRFTCRVGHVFSTNELIAGKERKLDEWLWSALLATEELSQLLSELARTLAAGPERAELSSRARRLRAQAEQVRRLIENNQPIALGSDAGLTVAECDDP